MLDPEIFVGKPRGVSLALVRHAEAVFPDPHYFTPPGPGLSAAGNRQIERLRVGLPAWLPFQPQVLLTSPFRRCELTATALGLRWGLPVTLDGRLREFDPAVGDQVKLANELREVLQRIHALAALIVTHGIVVEAIMRLCGVDSFTWRTASRNVVEPAGCFAALNGSEWAYLAPDLTANETLVDGSG